MNQTEFMVNTPSSELPKAIEPNMTLGFLAALSFTIGMFPNSFFRFLISTVSRRIRQKFSVEVPLEKLKGLNPTEITRLWEEGVVNVDQLADCSVEDLYRKTRFSAQRLKSLIGKAILWKYILIKYNKLDFSNKNKDINNKDKQIGISITKDFPFEDIQSLCAYFFDKPLEDIEKKEDIFPIINSKRKDIETFAYKYTVDEEAVLSILYRSWEFKIKLKFTETEAGIKELLDEELINKS